MQIFIWIVLAFIIIILIRKFGNRLAKNREKQKNDFKYNYSGNNNSSDMEKPSIPPGISFQCYETEKGKVKIVLTIDQVS